MQRSNSVPFLPGHSMHGELNRANHRRQQTLIYKLDSPADNIAQRGVSLDAETLKAMSVTATFQKSASATNLGRTAKPEKNSYKPAVQPAWLKHDRQALRFYAYYQEPVVENAVENFRIRNVVFTYFLEDGTMQITEPKVENSGIWPQGPFVKRHRIPKQATGGFFGPEDLVLGTEVTIYARVFRIINCDEFTKWFYQQGNIEIGVEEPAPLDTFFETQVWKKESMTKKIGWPKDVMDGKEYNELKLGGGRKNHRLEQFLQNDRKVLRFYAYWDDPTRYGARQYYTMHYFLSDDTVEINNNYARNSGRWQVPVFFKRAPLELNPTSTPFPGMIKPPSPLLSPADIQVGQTIPVFGRAFFIYDCDDATKAFYQDYMGVTIQSITIPEPEQVHMQLLYPPHNGLGGDEDSLGSCIQLRPKPPKKDLVKLMTNTGRILRYECIPENQVPEDAHRKFIVAYFLADDQVACYEVKIRNSGVWEGTFKKKDLTINPVTGKSFQPGDFFVGARFSISSMPLLCTRADEYSLKYMETDPASFPQSSFSMICDKLLQLAENAPQNAPSAMTPEDFRDFVYGSIGVELTDQELITVLRSSANEAAEIQMDTLYEFIRDPPMPPVDPYRAMLNPK